MELPRLLVLTCVLGVSAALFYARGAPARGLPVTDATIVTAEFPPAPTLPWTITPAAPTDSTPKHVALKPRAQQKRRHHH